MMYEFYIKERPLFTLSKITYPGTSFNMASTMSSSSGMVASLGTCFFGGFKYSSSESSTIKTY